MRRDHRPLELDLAHWIRGYLDRGGNPDELLTAIGESFPGTSYGTVGRALALAEGVHHARAH